MEFSKKSGDDQFSWKFPRKELNYTRKSSDRFSFSIDVSDCSSAAVPLLLVEIELFMLCSLSALRRSRYLSNCRNRAKSYSV